MEPWAYAAIEALTFSLLALWMARGLTDGKVKLGGLASRSLGGLILPVTLLVGLIGLQLVPLPPAFERLISPATFELYQRSLPGWPDIPLQDHIRGDKSRDSQPIEVLPTAEEAAAGAPIPYQNPAPSSHGSNGPAQSQSASAIGVWRTLSISPALTEPPLLKLLSYAGLFFLVAAYPFSDDAERSLGQRLAQVALVAGLLAASIALLERVYSNGRALWLFLPYDWSKGDPWGARAVGSFANPDHLANFLDQTLPFAVVGLLWPAALARRRPQVLRMVAGAALVIISSALLLSSSRGGWLGALMVMVVLGMLWPRGDEAASRRTAGRLAVGLSVGFFLLLLLFVGPGGRTQTDARLKQTVADDSLIEREAPAVATIALIRDFPLFGVGLGCWPEVFPRYERPPWASIFWNATHNDYIQMAAETGVIGFALLAWFLIGVGRRIRGRRATMRPGAQLLVAAALGAASAAAIHESFDFPLQVPANALLLTALLGLAVRLTDDKKEIAARGRTLINPRYVYALGLLGAVGLLLAALFQTRPPYPYNLKRPTNVAQAYRLINAHPANAKAHLALAGLLADAAPAASRIKELRAAIWLDPTNPYSRDIYAQTLLEQNETALALQQIVRSVSYSPDPMTHFYLERRIVPWLPEPERKAISAGFKFAVAHRYPGAVEYFASYDDELGDVKAEAALYQTAAAWATGDARHTWYLENAGTAFLNAGEPQHAEAAFRAAIAASPDNSDPYVRLIIGIFGPSKTWPAANALIAHGIEHGADPVALYQALAQGAQAAGAYAVAREALQKALAVRPANFDVIMQAGRLDLADNRPDQAATWFRRAAQLMPHSAEAFSDLGSAEEVAYEYAAADEAYRQAVGLAPGDAELKARYAAFQQRVARSQH